MFTLIITTTNVSFKKQQHHNQISHYAYTRLTAIMAFYYRNALKLLSPELQLKENDAVLFRRSGQVKSYLILFKMATK